MRGKLKKINNPEALSVGRRKLAVTTIGDYGLFGGGYGNAHSSIVDAYAQEKITYKKYLVSIS